MTRHVFHRLTAASASMLLTLGLGLSCDTSFSSHPVKKNKSSVSCGCDAVRLKRVNANAPVGAEVQQQIAALPDAKYAAWYQRPPLSQALANTVQAQQWRGFRQAVIAQKGVDYLYVTLKLHSDNFHPDDYLEVNSDVHPENFHPDGAAAAARHSYFAFRK